jgi:hypothetical protein
MGKFGGDLSDFGQTGSLVLKNIDATYKRPNNQLEQKTQETDISTLTYAQILELVPKNWHDESSDYWSKIDEEYFSCRDGQTNVYVKRGTDEEVEEVFDRQEASVLVWHIATDDNHIDFLAGGKVKAKGAEWFVLKVIQQDSTGTYANRYFAMDTHEDNDRLRRLGLKTLVCVGGVV